jgi:transposase-like protein
VAEPTFRFETDHLGTGSAGAGRRALRRRHGAEDGAAESGVENRAGGGTPAGAGDETTTSGRGETQARPRARAGTRRRRRFSAEYKLDILRRVDACSERGEIGALLRAEGLYFSHLTKWRRERERGALEALRAKRPGPKTSGERVLTERIGGLEEEVRTLRSRLERAERLLAHAHGSVHKTRAAVSRRASG